MKLTTSLLGATALCAMTATAAHAVDLEVTHWWTSGGEANAVSKLADAWNATGNKWVDGAIAGVGASSSQASLAPTIRGGKVPITGTYTTTKLLSEPTSPLVYGGFCGYPQMAQTGVGYYTEQLKLKAPKVMVVSIESAGGVEYHQYIDAAVKKLGGTSSLVTMKVTAADGYDLAGRAVGKPW